MQPTTDEGKRREGSATSPAAWDWLELDELVSHLEEHAAAREGRPVRPTQEVWAVVRRMAASLWPVR